MKLKEQDPRQSASAFGFRVHKIRCQSANLEKGCGSTSACRMRSQSAQSLSHTRCGLSGISVNRRTAETDMRIVLHVRLYSLGFFVFWCSLISKKDTRSLQTLQPSSWYI